MLDNFLSKVPAQFRELPFIMEHKMTSLFCDAV